MCRIPKATTSLNAKSEKIDWISSRTLMKSRYFIETHFSFENVIYFPALPRCDDIRTQMMVAAIGLLIRLKCQKKNLPQQRQQINESVAQAVTLKPHFRFEFGKIIKIRIKEDFLRSLFRCHHLKFSIWIFYVCKFVLIGYIISSYPHWNWIFSQKWLYYHWNWESHWWWVEITFRTVPSGISRRMYAIVAALSFEGVSCVVPRLDSVRLTV